MLIDDLYDIAIKNNLPVYSITEALGENLTSVGVNNANRCNNIYSVSKNFTATAIGMLVDRKMLKLSDTVGDIFSDARWNDVTVRDVLTQTVGIEKGFLDIDVEDIYQYGSNDFLRLTLDRVPTLKPGTHFLYSDSNYYLLSRIFSKISGIELNTFLQRELFTPLEFQSNAWVLCPHGYAMGATGLFISSSDMAKLGVLYASGGVYKGKRLLSEKWVYEASHGKYYAYSFWLSDNNPNVFSCRGMFCQAVFINTSNKHVISWQAFDNDGLTTRLFEKSLAKTFDI